MAALKGVWSLAWNAIKNVVKSLLTAVVSNFSSNLSKLKGYASSGVNAVKNFFVTGFQALYTVVKNKLGSVVSTVKEIPDKAKSALSGLPGQMLSIGKNIIDGIVNGIRNSLGRVMSAAKAIVDQIPGPIRKALGIHSPSRVMAEIGKFITEGLVVGINGGTKKLQDSIAKLTKLLKAGIGANSSAELKKANQALQKNADARRKIMRKIQDEEAKLKKKGLSKTDRARIKEDIASDKRKLKSLDAEKKEIQAEASQLKRLKKNGPAVLKMVNAYNVRLNKLAKARDQVHSKLVAAQSKLDDLKKAKADMASSVSGKAKDYGSIMGAFDSSEYGDNSTSAILARLKTKLKGITDFRKNLQTLAKRGLGKGIIAELAQAGPEEGGKMAQALLNAGGGQIKELNSTYNAIGSESDKLGEYVSSNYYDAGIRASEGLVKGLKAREKALTKAIENMSKAMVKALRKALGIKSPSRVFKVLGGFTAEGFEHGIRNGQGDVQKAIDEMAATRPTGRVANRSIARAMAVQGKAQAAPTVYVTVQGNVTAEKALARSIATTIRDEIVRNGKRNGGRTGL